MPENAAAVDSADVTAAVDSAANEESQPMGGSSQKTYTAEELDQRIKERIDKQRARFEEQMGELTKQVEELTRQKAEADAKAESLQAERDRQTWLQAAADATGVPLSLIRGESAEECMAHAEAIKAATNVAPVIKDGGGSKPPAPSRESILAIENERERLNAIKSNPELFS